MQTITNTNTNPTQLLSPPKNIPNQTSPVYLAPPQPATTRLPPSTFAGQFVNAQSQAGLPSGKVLPGTHINQTTQHRIISGGAVGPQVQKISTQQSAPPKPTSTSRIEYVPYDKKVVDYETRQIVSTMWVPVQRKCLNYYAIQHITEYLPREVDDVRYEMVPEEHVEYRVQYVPVEKQIVHFPNDEAHNIRHDVNRQQVFYTNQNIGVVPHQHVEIAGVSNTLNVGQQHNLVTGVSTVNGGNQHLVGGSAVNASGYQQPLSNATNSFNVPGYQALPSRGLNKSNFVTSDGYVPSYYSPLAFQSQNQPSFLREQEVRSGIASNLRQASREGSVGLNTKTKQNQNNLDSYYSPARNWDRNAF